MLAPLIQATPTSSSASLSFWQAHEPIVIAIAAFAGAILWDLILRGMGKREREREAKEQNSYSWLQCERAARKVGRKLITEFKPDAILTFAGSSAIFANYVLLQSLEQVKLLRLPIYLGRFLPKDEAQTVDLVVEGFELIESTRYFVLLPRSLSLGDRKMKIAIIDDTTTTGSAMARTKEHLLSLGYKSENIMTGCFVCCSTSMMNNAALDVVGYYNVGHEYELPWGTPPT